MRKSFLRASHVLCYTLQCAHFRVSQLVLIIPVGYHLIPSRGAWGGEEEGNTELAKALLFR